MAKPNEDSLIGGLEVRAATGTTGKTVYDLLESKRKDIERALPNVGITAEQLVRVIQTQIRLVPALGECTPQSLLGAIMLTAQLGLEPGPLGQAYLLPFNNNKTGKKEVTFIVGYKGLIALAYRSSGIIISAHDIHENDTFEFDYGTNKAVHTFRLGQPRGAVIGFWSRAEMPNGNATIKVMDKAEVDEHKKRSAAGDYGPWKTDYLAMGRKTVIRVHAAQLPLASNLVQRAIASDETAIVFDSTEGAIPAEQAPVVDVTEYIEVEGEIEDNA
jgi:recombination protein RecT